MRLRRKPWIDEAIHEYDSHIILSGHEEHKGKWRELFAHPERPLYMELGTGKGRFIAGMSEAYPDANFVGFEVQLGVIYYAAQKIFEGERNNAKVSLFDIAGIEEIVAPGEVDRFYINFCDPWPKAKHAKRRLTSRQFLARYEQVLKEDGIVEFKTDNNDLFDFSLEQIPEAGWNIVEYTRDLHNNEKMNEGNIMTEYEERFSKMGNNINKLIVNR